MLKNLKIRSKEDNVLLSEIKEGSNDWMLSSLPETECVKELIDYINELINIKQIFNDER